MVISFILSDTIQAQSSNRAELDLLIKKLKSRVSDPIKFDSLDVCLRHLTSSHIQFTSQTSTETVMYFRQAVREIPLLVTLADILLAGTYITEEREKSERLFKKALENALELPCKERYWVFSALFHTYIYTDYLPFITAWMQENQSRIEDDCTENSPHALLYRIRWATFQNNFEQKVEHLITLQKFIGQNPELPQWWTYFVAHELADVYYGLQEYDKAATYFIQIRHFAEPLSVNLASSFNNIGAAYKNASDYEKALVYLDSCVQVAQKLPDTFYAKAWEGIARENIAQILVTQKSYELALVHLSKAIPLTSETNQYSSYLGALITSGRCYAKKGQLQKAELFFDSAKIELKRFEQLGVAELINWRKLMYELSLFYAQKQDYQQAYEAHLGYVRFADSIKIEAHKKEVEKLQSIYNVEQKEHQLTLQKNELQFQKKRNLWAIAFGTLMIFIVFYLFYSNRQKQHLNQSLVQKKQKLEETNNQLAELNQFKEQMTSMIAHDIKNPLNTVIALTDEQSFRKENGKYVQQAGYQVLNLITNMLDVHKYENVRLEIQPKSVSLAQLIQTALAQIQVVLEQKSLTIQMDFSQDFILHIDKDLMVRVVVNILSNAVKYSPMNGTIFISEYFENQVFTLKIKDEGHGIPQAFQEVIFEKFSQAQPQQYGAVPSTGLGLTFAKMAVEAHGGQIGVRSEEGRGAEFWFTMPLQTVKPKSTDIPLALQTPHKQLSLTATEIIFLQSYTTDLQELEIYQASEILHILEQIPSKSEGIDYWKTQIREAILDYREADFTKLMTMVI